MKRLVKSASTEELEKQATEDIKSAFEEEGCFGCLQVFIDW